MTNDRSHIDLKSDQRMREAISSIMSAELGRYFIFRLLDTYGVNSTAFSGNALQTAFACGLQNAGFILQDLAATHASESFLLMLKEKPNVRPNPKPRADPYADD